MIPTIGDRVVISRTGGITGTLVQIEDIGGGDGLFMAGKVMFDDGRWQWEEMRRILPAPAQNMAQVATEVPHHSSSLVP